MSLENIVYRMIERWMASRYTERHALVTAYDPKNYLAKVTLQPEGQETGWLLIETGHIGSQYGIAIGLQPGDGKSTGDQVVVRYQEGDLESAKVVQRVHSDNDKPPEVQSGEAVIWTRFQNSGGGQDSAQGGQGGAGQQIYLKNDGSLSLTDGNGATMKFDGLGNVFLSGKKLQLDFSDVVTLIGQKDVGIKGGGNVVVKAGAKLGIEAAEAVWQDGDGDVSDGAVTPPGSAPSVPKFQTP